MGGGKYEPFRSAREFSGLMLFMFDLYRSYSPDTFSFDFLQRTKDLEVVCRDTTAEDVDVDFPTLGWLDGWDRL